MEYYRLFSNCLLFLAVFFIKCHSFTGVTYLIKCFSFSRGNELTNIIIYYDIYIYIVITGSTQLDGISVKMYIFMYKLHND